MVFPDQKSQVCGQRAVDPGEVAVAVLEVDVLRHGVHHRLDLKERTAEPVKVPGSCARLSASVTGGGVRCIREGLGVLPSRPEVGTGVACLSGPAALVHALLWVKRASSCLLATVRGAQGEITLLLPLARTSRGPIISRFTDYWAPKRKILRGACGQSRRFPCNVSGCIICGLWSARS